MTTLDALLPLVPAATLVGASVEVGRVRSDSRVVERGDLFVALDPDDDAARIHAADAIARGASALVARTATSVPTIVTSTPALALARIAEKLEGNPTQAMTCSGITGTNGKTTTTRLVEQALLALGERPALIGTGILRGPGFEESSVFTTPFGDAISRFARRAVDAGATHLVMEVSSHALDQHRADGVAFDVVGFTNLTRDHLDYHPSMEAYGAAKARLFTDLGATRAVIHVGDPFGKTLADLARGEVFRVAIDDAADITVVDARYEISGIDAVVTTPKGRARLRSPLVGRHNLENLLVALGCLLAIDVPLDRAVRALEGARGAEGRLERVDCRSFGVFVDYAHTPDAIARVLAALRPLTAGRLIAVFGCGGDRDRGKRPAMAKAAALGADVVIITSDNPRTEDPKRIVEDIVAGIDPSSLPAVPEIALAEVARGHVVEIERKAAIDLAIAAARPGDTVILAGKGHEDYQIIGTTKYPFDDRVEARRALRARGEVA